MRLAAPLPRVVVVRARRPLRGLRARSAARTFAIARRRRRLLAGVAALLALILGVSLGLAIRRRLTIIRLRLHIVIQRRRFLPHHRAGRRAASAVALAARARRLLAGPSLSAGRGKLLTAALATLARRTSWRSEEAAEVLVESGAVALVLDQRCGQRLAHPRASRPAAATAFIASIDSATEMRIPAARRLAMNVIRLSRSVVIAGARRGCPLSLRLSRDRPHACRRTAGTAFRFLFEVEAKT